MKYSAILISCLLATASTLSVQTMDAPVSNQKLPQAIGDKEFDHSVNPKDKKDIANKEVRPDVYQTVFKMVDPVPERRRKNPPKPPRKWDDGPGKLGEDDEDTFAKKNATNKK